MKFRRSAGIGAVLLVAVLTFGASLQAQTTVGPTAPAATSETRKAVVLTFEGEDSLNSLAAKGKTVVFFFASWCPNCRATVTELNARWSEVNPDITLVIADYDKETALKRKFGVTYQDTFVLLDSSGAAVKFWNSGGVDGLNKNSSS